MRPAILACCLAASAGLTAQQPTSTFKTGVDLVPVDVSVVDRNGRPVNDLTAADFTLTVDGKPRAVASASYISTERLSDAPPDRTTFSTNAGQRPGRLIALVIDEAHIARGGATMPWYCASSNAPQVRRSTRTPLRGWASLRPTKSWTVRRAWILRPVSSPARCSRPYSSGSAPAKTLRRR